MGGGSGGPGVGFGGPGGGFRTGRSGGKPLLMPTLKNPTPRATKISAGKRIDKHFGPKLCLTENCCILLNPVVCPGIKSNKIISKVVPDTQAERQSPLESPETVKNCLL